jgi:trafficking protein particle complex subunit 9
MVSLSPPCTIQGFILVRLKLTLSLSLSPSTHGSILIDYAYLDRPGMVQRPTLFHTRQIIFPVLLTVYHTLECTSMDILRLPSSGSAGRDMLPRHTKEEEVEDLSLSSLLRKKDADEEYCLLAVDVRNVYGQSFEVSFQRENDREGGK